MRTPAWQRNLGLSGVPFSKDIADEKLWLPTSRKEVVDELVDALQDREHAIVVGDPGVGKTCMLRALRHRLPESGFRLTYCHNASIGRRDFYRHICLALNLPAKATAASVFWELQQHVRDLSRDKLHPVFMLDEAHLMQDPVLTHLHVLANYDWDQQPLLSLLLIGLPDLWRRLNIGIHRSLWSRIHCRISLEPAKPEDTNEYIAYRLGLVGAKPSLFASDALALLHESTSGQLRDIDRLANAALRTAGRRKLKLVDHDLILDVVDADSKPN